MMADNGNSGFSHRHWCEVYGHDYQCGEDCVCICGLPMNGSDHSDCPVELRPCPEHKAEQECRMAEAMARGAQAEAEPFCEEQDVSVPHCKCGCSEIDPGEAVGWCFHCDHVYVKYNPELEAQHFAYHCPEAPHALKESARARLAKRGT